MSVRVCTWIDVRLHHVSACELCICGYQVCVQLYVYRFPGVMMLVGILAYRCLLLLKLLHCKCRFLCSCLCVCMLLCVDMCPWVHVVEACVYICEGMWTCMRMYLYVCWVVCTDVGADSCMCVCMGTYEHMHCTCRQGKHACACSSVLYAWGCSG